MTEPLERTKTGDVSYLHYPAWTASGFVHGFTGASLNFRKPGIPASAPVFLDAFGVRRLYLLDQVHGNRICRGDDAAPDACSLVWAGEEGEVFRFRESADAFVLPAQPPRGFGFGVTTADCAPILLRSASGGVALVHAGWRGLAAGIAERAAAMLGGSPVEAVIGPCASERRYEVGEEVTTQLGSRAVHFPSANGKRFLSVAKTAARALSSAGVKAYPSLQCTIESADFHSFRRDKDRMGLNLAFFVMR